MKAASSSKESTPPPIKVFISYSHKNRKEKDALSRELFNLNSPLELLSDDRLMPGDNWENALSQLRAEANLFLLLVSEDYVHSTMVAHELEQILLRNTKEQIRIIPIILDGCNWYNQPYAAFQSLPRDARPVSSFNIPEMAFKEIAREVYSVIELQSNKDLIRKIEIEKQRRTGTLFLEKCKLKTIPRDLLEMTWLEHLHLGRNSITKIENLESLTALKTLFLDHNSLTKIENLDTLVNLEALYITNNELTEIDGLAQLSNLTILDLKENKITSISGLEGNKNLKTLGLTGNRIGSTAGMAQLTSLQTLYLAHNVVEDLGALVKLPQLQRIILTNNKITSIKPLLGHIIQGLPVSLDYSFNEQDRGIYLAENILLNEPSVEVLKQGREAIVKYFEDADIHGTTRLEIVKMILVGNSRVGKTNFSEYIRTGKISETSYSTHLLDIKPWKPAFLKSATDNLMQVNIFDFGGQDYYHDAHRMYYSHDTAYVLLWDVSTNKYQEKEENEESGNKITYENFPLEYWLESIKYNLQGKADGDLRGNNKNEDGESIPLKNLLVLQNKIDLSEGLLNQQTLVNKYPNIWGFYNISLTAQKRTVAIEEVVGEFMNGLNLGGRMLVKFESKIITHFLSSAAGYKVFSLEDFQQECIRIIDNDGVAFNKDNAEIIAHILNNTGIALYEKDEEGAGWLYTNIKALNDRIRAILDVAMKGSDKGIFSIGQIAHIDNRDEVLALLSRNNSIIKINEEDYLAPQFLPVLPDDSISFFLPAFGYCQMRFVYKAYFHKTLLLNLFSRYLKGVHIETSDGIRRFPFWRNGILISRGEGEDREMVFVSFEKNLEAGIVNIRTMHPFNKNRLEKDIEQTLDKLNEGWTVSKELSVNGKDFFNVNALKAQIEKHQYEVQGDQCCFSINEFRNIVDFQNLPKKIFISYSSKNAAFIKRFATHLDVLKTNGIIEPWYDRMIESGTRWNDVIHAEMRSADVIIFLLSPDFIATEYIMKTEIPLAIEQMKKARSKFFFVELQPCSWQRTVLNEYQQTDDPTNANKNVVCIQDPGNDAQWNTIINELEAKLKAG